MAARLQDKVAVITGSTRGLGRSLADAFRREGAKVVVSSRTASAVDDTVAALGGDGDVLGVPCDVSDLGQVERLGEQTLGHFGRIDIWVNNAALKAPYARTLDVPVDEYTRVLHVNTLGTYYGSRVALNHMLARGAGKLINLSGRGAHGPSAYQNAYAPSKAWAANFTLALAKEYAGRGVDVMVFSPGMVLTDLLTNIQVIGRDLEGRFKRFPRILRMFAEPPEVPAAMAVEIAASGKNGRYYEFLDRRRKLTGAWGELRRSLTRSDEPMPQIHVHVRDVG